MAEDEPAAKRSKVCGCKMTEGAAAGTLVDCLGLVAPEPGKPFHTLILSTSSCSTDTFAGEYYARVDNAFWYIAGLRLGLTPERTMLGKLNPANNKTAHKIPSNYAAAFVEEHPKADYAGQCAALTGAGFGLWTVLALLRAGRPRQDHGANSEANAIRLCEERGVTRVQFDAVRGAAAGGVELTVCISTQNAVKGLYADKRADWMRKPPRTPGDAA
ncbi:hypothetical protein JL720_602 [Aureococcus anophagefferens]|nr:hypothetical protein JL720_602 [Aureococcus anophagefferens]